MLRKHATRGFTLVECVVASFVLLIVSLSFILSLIYSLRASTLAALETSATHLVQGEIERIRSMPYETISAANIPDTNNGGLQTYLDGEQRVPVTLEYDFLSTFSVTSSTGATATVSEIPSNAFRQNQFKSDEWAGHNLVVIAGTGYGQRAYIKGNTDTQFTITTDTTGKTDREWYTRPDNTSIVQLDTGKLVTVRAKYALNSRELYREVQTLVLPADL